MPLKMIGRTQTQGMVIALILAVGLERKGHPVQRNEVVLTAIFGQDIVVGQPQGELLDLQIPSGGKDVLVCTGNLGVVYLKI